MAHNDYEIDPERGQPVELYKFVYGTSFFAYTNAEREIVFDDGTGNVTYEPISIDRASFETKGKLDSKEVEFEVPLNAPVADLFRIYPPSQVVSIIVRQGHLPNPDDPVGYATGESFPVAWTGRVLESSRDGSVATLVCESLGAGMRRTGLRRHYQYPCPLVLYSPRCGADKQAATTATTVSAVNGNRVTLPAAWNGAQGLSGYVGGLAEWTGANGAEVRTIRRVEADGVTLVLSGPATGLSVSDAIDVILGCPHTFDGCGGLHNNEQSYGGHLWIPGVNPVGKNNHT